MLMVRARFHRATRRACRTVNDSAATSPAAHWTSNCNRASRERGGHEARNVCRRRTHSPGLTRTVRAGPGQEPARTSEDPEVHVLRLRIGQLEKRGAPG